MKKNVFVRDYTNADVLELIENIRSCDREEVAALSSMDLAETIRTSAIISTKTWAAVAPTQGLICLFGYANMSDSADNVGVPWLLGTDLMKRYQKSLLRISPPYLRVMHSVHPTLRNIVHADNHESIKFLEWLGFEFSPTLYLNDDKKKPVKIFTRIEEVNLDV